MVATTKGKMNGSKEWKTSQAVFMGHVRAKLESIEAATAQNSLKIDRNFDAVDKRFDELYEKRCKEHESMIRNNKEKLSNIKLQLTIIAFLAGAFATATIVYAVPFIMQG